jgi:hypothetical protein
MARWRRIEFTAKARISQSPGTEFSLSLLSTFRTFRLSPVSIANTSRDPGSRYISRSRRTAKFRPEVRSRSARGRMEWIAARMLDPSFYPFTPFFFPFFPRGCKLRRKQKRRGWHRRCGGRGGDGCINIMQISGAEPALHTARARSRDRSAPRRSAGL